jgi:hypothetical protein
MARGFLALSGLSLVLVATVALAQSTATQGGVTFGRTERLSGVYFTNFENSTFVRCDRNADGCRSWVGSPESYGLMCEPAACADLERQIVTLNGSHDRWGLFAIEFTGRRSIAPNQSRGPHDPAKKVLVERIEKLTLLETQ